MSLMTPDDDSCAVCEDLHREIAEIHEMLTKFTEALEQLGKNPMLRAMVPPGILKK